MLSLEEVQAGFSKILGSSCPETAKIKDRGSGMFLYPELANGVRDEGGPHYCSCLSKDNS